MLQVVKEKINEYDIFIKEITEKVKEKMGEGYSTRIYKVTKNNSLELDSLVMLKEGKNFAPNIYLLPYYEAYVQGTDMNELANRLCSVYYDCNAPMVDEKFSYFFEDMKTKIIYRLVSYDRNEKLLEQVPHIRYLDLAITFHCLVRDDENGIGTIRITSEHMKQWKASLQELRTCAIKNTKRMFPYSIKSMEEVIKSMLTEEMGDREDDLPEELLYNIKHENNASQKHRMYILTNLKGINGATCLLYENVLQEFADQIDSDIFILPSSIHEVILVPYDKSITREALAEMVKDINHTQVAHDEVLSDKVYLYSRNTKSLSVQAVHTLVTLPTVIP